MITSNELSIAKQVLTTETEGLEALLQVLDEKFLKVIDIISNSSGRVIVSGMGKSGHIARKIASTFSSTGTSSFFVHPGEASHGDLGMIAKDDVVILLSNSGETSELRDIIKYCKRFSIKLIAIVGNHESILSESADVALILPNIKEVCDLNAPTTSTTMMLALGDAIAITLSTRKGFTKENFTLFHPGGKLGGAITKVTDFMRVGDKIPLVFEDQLMPETLLEMSNKKLGCTGVINHNRKLTGIITDGDLRRHLTKDLLDQQASAVMTKNPIVVKPSLLAVEALNIMNSKSITSLFVIENEEILGIVHIHDCLILGVK